jgi:endoglucanase
MIRFIQYSLWISLFFILFHPFGYSQGFLKTSGKKIINGYGQEVLLRGMGLGGWLVQEGYMLQTSDFANAQWQIREKISALIGEVKTEEFYQLYRENYVRKKDIDKLAEWGFNSVRLPMHFNLFNPQPGVYSEEGFKYIDSLLSWCRPHNMYVILDLHAAAGGQSANNICDYNPALPSLWESEQNRTRTIELWRSIALRYAAEDLIGGYDLLNEPAWELGPVNQMLMDLYQDITSAIRQVDTNHIIFIEGNWYATDFRGLTPAWDNNMVYSFHKYWNSNSSSSIASYLTIRNTTNTPLWLGESGENSNVWFNECIELVESNNIGWAWWPHKKIDNIAGPVSAVKTPGYEYLLKYWRGQAVKPTQEYAINALFGMANKLDLDECNLNPGVTDALFRQKNNTSSKPWKHHKIPGIIYAADYDMGKHNYAYKDTDYQNVGGGSWNTGGKYRNDGVDIEACSDIVSNGFNVGWTNTGEYLSFTAEVEADGLYDIEIRIASNQAGGKMLLKMDNINLGSVLDVPVTGGWQEWSSIFLEEVYLSKGLHTLRTDFYFGGFNVNCFYFTPGASDMADDPLTPAEFLLKQNYPNPFNPSTMIEYSLNNPGAASLKIYDLLGVEIITLFDEYRAAGNYTYEFSAADYNFGSGIYFYRLVSGERSSVRKFILLK